MLLVIIPFWTSALVRIYGWKILLQGNGPINTVLKNLGLIEKNIKFLGSYGSVLLAMVYCLISMMILPCHSSVDKMDFTLVEAARDLGCGSISVLRRVIFPLSMPGVISGVTMVLIPSISTFYISQKLGNGKFFLIGDAIEGQYVANNLHFAAAIAFILMVILLVCMAVMRWFANRKLVAA
jgi:spermidine/putrescine transport system permease protein